GLPQELLEEIAKLGGGSVAFAVRQGQKAAVTKALALVRDSATPLSQREELVAVLGEAKQPTAVPVLLDIVGGKAADSLRRSALAALQAYGDDRIGAVVVGLYPHLAGDVREAAETLLISRKQWGKQLLAAVAAGNIEPASVPRTTLKKLLLHHDSEIDAVVQKHWGEIKGATTLAMQQEVDRLLGVVRARTGNPHPGKKLFVTRC